MSDSRNRWHVITGPPCCGKSTTIDLLAARGFRVRTEVARAHLDEALRAGRSVHEVRARPEEFQVSVLMRALAVERSLPPEELIFFDRGVPDSLAYFRLHGLPEADYMSRIAAARYRTVFYLEPLSDYVTDYARVESRHERDRLADLLWRAYADLAFDVVRVPVLPAQERIDFILRRIAGAGDGAPRAE
ncbi:conserved hypothetical protein [Methylobacterium sp. 4-46]|uniref:AAA family ATPase n=1 Tax=unclassified Methylobacterium TaxID=2615210 RepID=UPI000152E03C|nr:MULTISPECIES: ATP-binding protein [Methylobacterium]ACA15593.1 conserved hypothetical protein [Methylobacterium sp. 4-46]WFT81304.1 ATP-binding protein [Methylobacterium nodulans]